MAHPSRTWKARMAQAEAATAAAMTAMQPQQDGVETTKRK
jgi:hypothetical protein